MQVPFRLVNALRLNTEVGLVAAVAVAMATFSATPLILRPMADEFEVSTSSAALFSAVQLGAFVFGSTVAGRRIDPSRRIFVVGLCLLALSNLVAAVAGSFALLVATRVVSGSSLGLLTWLAYSQVFGDDERTGDITTVGPLTAIISAPVIGVVLELFDVRAVFWLLTVLALLPLAKVPHIVVPDRTPTGRNRAVKAALWLIAALTIATLGGSSVVVFVGVIAADQYGMGAIAISLLFSLNAAAGVPSARYRGRRPFPGLFIIGSAVCALTATLGDQPWILWVAVTLWGAFFWLAIPGTYALLAARSRFPTERAGDAQAAMALGRSLGPLMGGFLVAEGDFSMLGWVGGGIMATAGVTILAVEALASPIADADSQA